MQKYGSIAIVMIEVDKIQSLPVDAANFVVNYGGFESRPLATTAALVAGAGMAAVAARYQEMRKAGELLQYSDPDMQEKARRPLKMRRIGAAITGLAAISAVSAGIAHEAAPYTEESHNRVDTVAAVVDTSWESYARDVQAGEDRTTRLQAAVNGINLLEDLSGVEVTFIAAGSNAEHMGSITEDAGHAEVVTNFENYLGNFRNRSSADLVGALNIADSIDADKILYFTGSLESVSSELRDEADGDRVSVIATGTPGTTVRYLGSEREAAIDQATNDRIVGADDSYTATSINEVQEIVSAIASEQYVETERNEFDGFETTRNLSAALLVMGAAAQAFRGGLNRLSRRKEPKVREK